MIDLGLARISRLLQHGPPPAWKAVHVAGTNGKGSVCAYLAAMLHARGIAAGRFTSPHLVDRWDCVAVDERPVAEAVFRAAEQAVVQRDSAEQIGATEFELLTATAFAVFDRADVAVAVVEAGVGGALDATTAMRATRAVTVLTRIGLDHQGLLGSTLAAITRHKAGILRAGVPCVVDPANSDGDGDVDKTIRDTAAAVGAPLVYPPPLAQLTGGDNLGLEPHQRANLACAYAAFRLAVGDSPSVTDTDDARRFLASIVKNVRWPGRLQRLDVGPLLGRPGTAVAQPALLDGAHNPQSADVLASYVSAHIRGTSNNNITWILAASHGKALDGILRPLLRPGDRVAAVAFGPVDGMPWVRPTAPQTILDAAAALGVLPGDQHAPEPGPDQLASAVRWAVSTSGQPLVIAGSLYLVSDTLRALRQAGGTTGLPE